MWLREITFSVSDSGLPDKMPREACPKYCSGHTYSLKKCVLFIWHGLGVLCLYVPGLSALLSVKRADAEDAISALQGLAEQLEWNQTECRAWLPGARGGGKGWRAEETKNFENVGPALCLNYGGGHCVHLPKFIILNTPDFIELFHNRKKHGSLELKHLTQPFYWYNL